MADSWRQTRGAVFAAPMAVALIGIGAAHFGVTTPMTGFIIFLAGTALAAGALLAALYRIAFPGPMPRTASMLRALPNMALIGAVVAVVSAAGDAPRINDITTDPIDPPRFVHAPSLWGNAGRNMEYPPAFASIQREHYPDIGPKLLEGEPQQVWEKVRMLARTMPGWTITHEDPSRRTIEGYETSRLFRFHDDFVVEVRAHPSGGSEVHMRSKSRDGRGDLGVNARRIRRFLEMLERE